jgi:hypothetical protein
MAERIVRVYSDACLLKMEAELTTERLMFLWLLSRNGVTVEEWCECLAQGVVGNLTKDEVNQLLVDFEKYDDPLDREPYVARRKSALDRCTPDIEPA